MLIDTEECPRCRGALVARYPLSAAWMLLYFFSVIAAFVGALFISNHLAVAIAVLGVASWFWRIRTMERAASFRCTACRAVFSFEQLTTEKQ